MVTFAIEMFFHSGSVASGDSTAGGFALYAATTAGVIRFEPVAPAFPTVP